MSEYLCDKVLLLGLCPFKSELGESVAGIYLRGNETQLDVQTLNLTGDGVMIFHFQRKL